MFESRHSDYRKCIEYRVLKVNDERTRYFCKGKYTKRDEGDKRMNQKFRRVKRVLAVALAVLMVGDTVDFSALTVRAAGQNAATAAAIAEQDAAVNVTDFAVLEEAVAEQQLPVGASETDIVFPDTLTATVVKAAGDNSTAETGDNTVSGDDVQPMNNSVTTTLTGITWKLDAAESGAPAFDGSADGVCYVYRAVLPGKDNEGNALVLADGVELPVIYVLVGAYGIATLADTTEAPVQVKKSDGTVENYATINAFTGGNCWTNCEITLNGNASLGGNCFFHKTVTLDLNGYTLETAEYALSFEGSNSVVKSSKSDGKITGTGYGGWQGYNDVLHVEGSGASCTIESGVTIEATGDRPAVYACANLIIEEGVTLTRANGKEVLRVRPGGNVTIEGVTFQGKVYRTSGGTLQISGGTFQNGIEVEGGTLADCFNGYGLKKSSGDSIVDLTAASVSDSVYVYQIPLRITEQPTLAVDQASVVEGYTAVPPQVSVAAAKNESVTGELSYQWRVKKQLVGGNEVDEEVEGATGTTFQIPANLAVGTYRYYCRVTCGSDSIDSDAVPFTVQAGLYGVAVNGTETLYADLSAALDAIEAAVEKATGATDITFKLRASVKNNAAVRVFSAGKYPFHLTVDLNGHELGNYGTITWLNTRDQCCIGVSGENAKLTVTDPSQEGNGELHGGFSAANGAVLEMTGGKCAYIYIESGARGFVKGGTCGMRAYIGNADASEGNAGTSCEVQGGLLSSIAVYGGAALTVTKDYTGKTDSLVVNHWARTNGATEKQRALVSLAGGSYGKIKTDPYCTLEEDLGAMLADPANGYAIADMLAEGYALFNNGFKLDLDRTALFYSNVEVKPADTPDNQELAVAEIVEDGTKKTYYTSWESVLDYLPKAGTVNSASVEVVLLKDISDASATETLTLNKADKYILRSPEGSHFTITGDGDALLKMNCTATFIIDNITLEDGFIEASRGEFIIKDALLQNEKCKAPVIRLSDGYLALEQGARLVLEGADDAARTVELTGAAGIFIADGAGINPSNNGKYGILVSGTDNSLVVPEGAGGKNIDAKLADGAGLTVYWTPDYLTDFIKELEAEKAASENITTYYQLRLPEGVSLPDGANSNIKVLNDILYGKAGSEITVGGITCAYQYATDTTGQISEAATTENKFIMPAATVTLITHEPDAYGYCAHCGKTDLAIAYQNGHLDIEGLTGRTYDSWPQMLTGITLVPGAGQAAVTLTMPDYRYQNSNRKWMMYAGGTPQNDDADFEVRYANNTAAYPYRAGEAGFDADKAPKVTITGRGQYTGEFTVYFTIGKGTMQPQVKDLEACGSGAACYYDGRTEKAWNNSLVEFYGDASDAKQWSQCGGAAQQYIQQITTPDVMNTYAPGSVVICPTTVEYSTDEKATWIMERLEGSSAENMYMITDAGEYPFWVRMTNVNCADAYISEKLVARITPKELTEGMVTFGESCGYYTGEEIEYTDYTVQDSGILVDGEPYTLVKGKDYTVSYENNTDVTTGESKAKLQITGLNNYAGTSAVVEKEFEIKYAFTPAQTTASKDRWYTEEVTALFGASDSTADAGQILYCSAVDAGVQGGIGSNITVYGALSDAIDGMGTGYVFTEEGVITRTLYVKDQETGYIGAPVEVTLQIDTNAPDWEAGGCGIQIKNKWWQKLLNVLSFGLFYNDTAMDVKLRAEDSASGVAKYYYYIQTVSATQSGARALTTEELDQLAFTEAVPGENGSVTLSGIIPKDSAEGGYVVYAYAVDRAGNKSGYLCSDGIVIDTTAPEITAVTAPAEDAGTLEDHTATVKFVASEAGTVVYFCVNSYDENASYTMPVKQVDGKWQPAVESGQIYEIPGITPDPVIYNRSMQAGENVITLSGLEANTNYRLYMISVDQAGNLQVNETTVDFTTLSVIPEIKVNPTLSGVYGMQAKDLQIEGGTVINPENPAGGALTGTWSFADTEAAGEEYPVPGTDRAYSLRFTPDAGSACGTVEVKVVPVVAKKELKINIMGELEKTYGEPNPEISYKDVDWVADLVLGDTEAELKTTLSMETEATETSDAGQYRFEVKSDSTKYEVKPQYVYADTSAFPGGTAPEYGRLTVKKAAISFSKGDGTYNKVFGDASFGLGVTVNPVGAEVQYKVTEGTDVVSVAADGTVTILKAGEAKIELFVPESINYDAATGPSFLVQVAKKGAVTLPEQNRSYFYNRDTKESIDIRALLPADCGKIQSHNCLPGSYQTDVVLDEESGRLTHTVAPNSVGAEDFFKLELSTENYDSITVTFRMKWTDRLPVFVKQGTEVSLKQSVLVYGDALSKLQFAPASFVDGDGNPVAGTLVWEDGTLTPDAGTASADWKFTPDSEDYAPLTGSVAITVNKAKPSMAALPGAESVLYAPSLTLRDVSLTGGSAVWMVNGQRVSVDGTWNWKEPSAAPGVGTNRYEVVFTPNDTINYESTLTGQITLTVEKATPYVASAPSAAAITYGDALSGAALTGGSVLYGDGRGNASALPDGSSAVSGVFTWKQPGIKPAVADSSTTEYTVVFTPAESGCYRTVEFTITLTVNKASNPPGMPTGTMNVSNACEKVAKVVLPNGWVWQESDRDTELEVGVEATATAIYMGADKDNYKVLESTVKLIRSSCAHTNTTVKNAVSATCTSGGYTGDIYCADCDLFLSNGTATPAAGHRGGTATCKKQAVCDVCHTSYGEKNPANHETTEVRGTKAATCTEGGYTGDTYCTACGVFVTAGKLTDALGHSYGSRVTKQPTTEEEGVRTYTCTVCGDSYTKTVPMLTGDGETTGTGGGRAPFIKGENGKEGWDVICEDVKDASEGDEITVDMNGSTVVPGDLFDLIRGEDITVVFDMGSGITWSVNGKDVAADSAKDIDFGVKFGAEAEGVIPVEVINNVTGEKFYTGLSLSYDGEFGFKAVLTLNVEEKNAGLFASLYYFNEQTGEMEFICEDEIGADGSVELTFTHASEYILVIDEKNAEQEPETGDGKAPDDGQATGTAAAPAQANFHTGWLLLLIGAVVAACVLVICLIGMKKRKDKDKE